MCWGTRICRSRNRSRSRNRACYRPRCRFRRHSGNEVLTWDPFLDSLQERTLHFFLETTPQNGLAYDRWPSRSPSSIGAVGFALTCYPIAVERGIITRDAAARRVAVSLRYLYGLPQHGGSTAVSGYNGFFYHFLDVRDGSRYWNCELSTIDTGLMLMGALTCQSYFDGTAPGRG